MYNRNRITQLNPIYEAQQRAILEICEEFGLVVYRPYYHATKGDNNTVLIYTKSAAEHNAKMDKLESEHGYRPDNDLPYACYLENTDVNGNFDLNFMNRGSLDLRSLDWKEKLKAFIRKKVEA